MKTEVISLFILVIVSGTTYSSEVNINKQVKCEVCKATMVEMEEAIAKIDPKKRIEVGGSRLDGSGNMISNSIQLKKSEVYLTELMESVCDRMDDYAKVRYKSNNKLAVLKLMTPTGMNPELSAVEFIQDGDLNKSLKHYCLEVLEDHEESALKFFMNDVIPKDVDLKLCTEIAGYCTEKSVEDYQLEEDDQKDEL